MNLIGRLLLRFLRWLWKKAVAHCYELIKDYLRKWSRLSSKESQWLAEKRQASEIRDIDREIKRLKRRTP